MALFVAFLSFILSTNGRDSGDYFTHYNQSVFDWGSDNGCRLVATYETGGRYDYQDWQGCEKTSLRYESQEEFDLTYWELLHVCPSLLKVPPEERGVVDYNRGRGKGKYLLPDKLVWSSSNTCSESDNWCPRWECDNSSALWDTDYNRSFTYHTTYDLRWSSIPLQKTCWKCGCAKWGSAIGSNKWVWTCENFGSAPGDDPLSSTNGIGWPAGTINPVDDPILFQVNKCQKPTPLPTPQPTGDTAGPTPGPTGPPTAGTYCTSVYNAFLTPGTYYWDTGAVSDCTTVRFCKCDSQGVGHCESSYSAIMTDTELYPGFVARCNGYMSECWTPDKAGQLFQWNDYAGSPTTDCIATDYYFCPRCGCTTDPWTQSSRTNTTSNTTIYGGEISSNSSSIEYTYACTECDCEYAISPRGGVSYMDCSNHVAYDAINNNEQYPNDLSVDCFYKPRKCFDHYGEYEADAGFTTCSDQREDSDDFGNYCEFARITFEDSSAENICIEDEQEVIGYWGCGNTWMCDLQGGPGTYYAEYSYSVTQYDCINDKWVGDKYSADRTYSCCNEAWNCNNRTIDEYMEDDMTKSKEIAQYMKAAQSCQYSQRNLYDLKPDESIIRAAFCGDTFAERLDWDDYVAAEGENKEMYCTLLKSYWQYYTFCSCNEARLKIKLLSEAVETTPIKDSDLMIKYWKQDFWNDIDVSSTERNNLKTMYGFWECGDFDDDDVTADTFFTCDFDAEVEDISNKNVQMDSAFKIFNNWTWIIVLISFLFNTKDNRFFSILFICILGSINILMVNGIDYDWSNSLQTGSSFEKCEFQGDVTTDPDTNNYEICEQITYEKSVFQNEDLTWDILVEACPELEYAGCYTKDEQMDMKKLIWPLEKYACNQCPQCPCSNVTDTQRHYVKNHYNLDPTDTMISRSCYYCGCGWNTNAEEYGWSCGWGGSQDVPYIHNDTEFCPGTSKPTSAPTEPLTLKCVLGSEFDSLIPFPVDRYGEDGFSHCMWLNFTRERYPNYEPAICVSDEIQPFDYWTASPNTQGLCIALHDSKQGAGCYYAEMDYQLREWDCARKKWITDKYRMDYTVYCCNDGHYCNNQTMVRVGDTLEYYSYENETETVSCKKSNKLYDYLKVSNCEDSSTRGLSDDYWHKAKCKGFDTDSKPTCDDLVKYWKYSTTCDCEQAIWWRNNVNSTYQKYIDDKFENDNTGLAKQLGEWNDTLNCGWKYGTKWYCSNGNMKFISIFYVVFVAASYVFVN